MIIKATEDLRIVAEDGRNFVVERRSKKGWVASARPYHSNLRSAVESCLTLAPHDDPSRKDLKKAIAQLDAIANKILESCDGAMSAAQASGDASLFEDEDGDDEDEDEEKKWRKVG